MRILIYNEFFLHISTGYWYYKGSQPNFVSYINAKFSELINFSHQETIGFVIDKFAYITACYYHVTYEFQNESTLYSLLECQGTPCSKQHHI